MTSSKGNIFRVTDPLWGNPPVTRGFFFDLLLNKRLSKQSRRRWFETSSHTLWRHCNAYVSTDPSSVVLVNPPPSNRQLTFCAKTLRVSWVRRTEGQKDRKLVSINMKSHYDDVIMGEMASQITSLAIVFSTVYWGADQRKHQSSASLVNSPHKWPVTQKMFPFDDVIMPNVIQHYSIAFTDNDGVVPYMWPKSRTKIYCENSWYYVSSYSEKLISIRSLQQFYAMIYR